MRLGLTRTGGVVGAVLTVSVDTAALPAAAAAHLQALLRAVNVAPGHTELPSDSVARDALGYQLEVTTDAGAISSLGFDFRSAKPELRALVQAIRRLAVDPNDPDYEK